MRKALKISFVFFFADITDLLCQHLSNGSVAIIYFTNTEKFGRSTAASQYFLQMAGFLGIPVIAWNADNAGLESVSASFRSSKNKIILHSPYCLKAFKKVSSVRAKRSKFSTYNLYRQPKVCLFSLFRRVFSLISIFPVNQKFVYFQCFDEFFH